MTTTGMQWPTRDEYDLAMTRWNETVLDADIRGLELLPYVEELNAALREWRMPRKLDEIVPPAPGMSNPAMQHTVIKPPQTPAMPTTPMAPAAAVWSQAVYSASNAYPLAQPTQSFNTANRKSTPPPVADAFNRPYYTEGNNIPWQSNVYNSTAQSSGTSSSSGQAQQQRDTPSRQRIIIFVTVCLLVSIIIVATVILVLMLTNHSSHAIVPQLEMIGAWRMISAEREIHYEYQV